MGIIDDCGRHNVVHPVFASGLIMLNHVSEYESIRPIHDKLLSPSIGLRLSFYLFLCLLLDCREETVHSALLVLGQTYKMALLMSP
jgi:hypothetical protein